MRDVTISFFIRCINARFRLYNVIINRYAAIFLKLFLAIISFFWPIINIFPKNRRFSFFIYAKEYI